MATSDSHSQGVRTLLLQHYPHLRPAEKKVAAFLLNVQPRADLSLEQLAKCSGASRSAVVRMCQALGLKGFRSFQLMWAIEAPLRSASTETTELSSEPPVFEPILHEFFKTEEMLDRRAIERAAQTILMSRHLAIYGNEGLSIAAQLANLWFSRIGLTVHLFLGGESDIPLPDYMDASATLLVLSMNGRNHQVLKLADEARERGSAVISILNDTSSPLATKTTTLLACAFPIREKERSLAQARVAVVQLAVLEVLVETVVRRRETFVNKGEELNR